MHKSLTVGANRTLILIYAAGVALLMIVTGSVVFLSCLIGAGSGAAAGFLQRRVLQTHAGGGREAADSGAAIGARPNAVREPDAGVQRLSLQGGGDDFGV